jgi:hypothetical protein
MFRSELRGPCVRRPRLYRILLIASGAIAIALLYSFDPSSTTGFLPCPFRSITGFLCPGCGAQRALHDLLHGRIAEAFHHNAALVIALPVLGLQWMVPQLFQMERRFVHDNRIVFFWLVAVILWGVGRNLFPFAHSH